MPGNNSDPNLSTSAVDITMAQHVSVPVSPPNKFDFSMPLAWPQWRKRFERFMSVSGQNAKSDEEKINILMYVLGEEAEEIMLQFHTIPDTYEATFQAFENHFIPRRNIIFERYKFNTRIQQPGESAESFITNLHSLAEHCKYGSLKDELIRDRIVVGMLDQRTSERLQLQSNLTLSECILAVKQAELQATQSKEIRGETTAGIGSINMHATSAKDKLVMASSSSSKQSQHFCKRGKNENDHTKKCQFCGLANHIRENCPASKSVCHSCKKLGHWSTVCRSSKSKVRSIQLDSLEKDSTDKNHCFNCIHFSNNNSDSNYLGSIQINNISRKEWIISLQVVELNKMFNFMIDSGADITCIPASLVSKNICQSLHKCNRLVIGPSGKPLYVLGILHATLSSSHKNIHTDIYIIKGLCKPILGRSDIIDLNILNFDNKFQPKNEAKLNAIKIGVSEIEKTFPTIFNEIGTFKTEMDIKVLDTIPSFIQSVPRIVPIPLMKPLKEELERLQNLNIIEPVDYHTPWVSPIVIVRRRQNPFMC